MLYRNVKNVFNHIIIVPSLFCTCTVGLAVAVQDNKRVVLLNGTKLGRNSMLVFLVHRLSNDMSAVWVLCFIMCTAFSQASWDSKGS